MKNTVCRVPSDLTRARALGLMTDEWEKNRT